MGSSHNKSRDKIVADPIHGDIHLSPLEIEIVDTASFQRLRYLKQLGFAHFVYPNATHTRFAHSLGALAVMHRVLDVAKEKIKLNKRDKDDLRLAALLHDIGHYPYSHLLESIGKVKLTEEIVSKETFSSKIHYPEHEDIGKRVVTEHGSFKRILGSKRAERVANLFIRSEGADSQSSKLIKSSLDIDRADYLLRDSKACGVPYGRIDLNYLLNCLQLDDEGALVLSEKGISAAEHFLFARFCMYKTVYYHKTIFGFEEVCRHLVRRLVDSGESELPVDGDKVNEIISKPDKFIKFTDQVLDNQIEKASTSEDQVIKAFSRCLLSRRPPKLLAEVPAICPSDKGKTAETVEFEKNCVHHLEGLADEYDIPLGQFILAETPPLRFEKRPHKLTPQEALGLRPDQYAELINVLVQGERKALVDVEHSLVSLISNHLFKVVRLYVVYHENDHEEKIEAIRAVVSEWVPRS